MPQFRYEARDRQGRQVSGQLEASDRLAASVKLREMELWIVRLEPVKTEPPAREVVRRAAAPPREWVYGLFPIKAAQMRDFFSQLGELLDAGVSVYEAMTVLPNRSPRRLRPILESISPALAGGQPLSEQLARYPHVFSRMVLGMIRAGERSGNIGPMCNFLADQYQLDHSIWLSLLIPRLYGWLVVMLSVLVPSLPGIISHGTEKAANWGWYLHHLTHVLLPLLAGLVVLDQVLRYVLRQPWAAGLRADLMYYLPGAAGYMRPAMYARVLMVMEAMVRTGASFAEALLLAAEAAGPGALGRQLQAAAAKVQAGEPLGPAVNRVTKLPFNARSALLTAEQAGRQEQTLGRLARVQMEAMEGAPKRVAVVGALAGVVVFGLIGGVALAYAYSSYLNATLDWGEKLMP